MKNMKRFLAMALCVIAMVTVFAIGFADGAHVSSKVSTPEVKVGDTVTFTVSMSETTVSSIGVTVKAPASFEVVSGEWLKSGTIANFDASKNKGAYAPGAAAAVSGDIFKVTLKAKTAGASAQEVKVEVVAKNGTNTLFTETANKSIKIICASHSFGAWSKTDSKHERTCSACGAQESASHTWDSGKVTAEATCTKEGTKTYTCTTCQHTKTESIDKKAHSYGAWTKLNDTQHEHKCSCGASEKANHKWDSGKVTTAATCTKPGVKTYTCSDCKTTKTEEIPTIAHSWDSGKVTTAATCSKEGVKTYTCSGCKTTKTESIAKTAHTYSNSCDADCNTCGAKRDAGHKYESTWSTDSKNHWHKCSVCGDVKDKAAHTESAWITDKEATDMEAGKRHKECTVCGKTTATETIPAKGCKHTTGTTISGKKDATCAEDGYTGDEVCKACKTVMKKGETIAMLGHDIELQNAKEATCQEDGYTGDEYCKRCAATIKQGEVLAKGEHNVEIVDAKEATCTEEGFTGKQICKTCEEIVNEGTAIDKTEHEYESGVCKNCGAKDPNYVEPTTPADPTEPEPKNNIGVIIAAIVAAAAIIASAIFFIWKRKKG